MSDYGSQNMVSQLKKVLMKKPQKFMSKVDPQKWNYVAPLNQRLINENYDCLLYTSPSPRDATLSRMPSSA